MSGVNAYINANTYTTSVTVTSSQILNSFTTPVVLIQGVAGKHIQPVSTLVKYTRNTTSYSTPNDFPISLGSVAQTSWVGGVLGDQLNGLVIDISFSLPSYYFQFNGTSTVFVSQYYNANGKDNLLFSCLTANPTLGDGTLTFDIMYRLVNA
tara:strand:- start:72 stop:527 length:456 start_codon:yes stop_codon:yes gene_type:complete